MGKTTGFLEFDRKTETSRSKEERLKDFKEVYEPVQEDHLREQASRCMDCGIPFCHSGCPIGNLCPEWNDLAYRGQWEKAWERLSATNNLPEITGRLCPALCEEACTLGIHEGPVAIRMIEKNIAEYAFEKGIVQPKLPEKRTGKKVAVVGSGPAGLSAAMQLNRSGHEVMVFEKDEKPGGLLRYGIPDFKLEKWVIDRRVKLMQEEGIKFVCNTNPDKDVLDEFDAVVICTGSGHPRNLPVPGREFNGIHFALEYLTGQNRLLSVGEGGTPEWGKINAKGKNVIVIGGGDTGSDCVGTALRQGAASVTSFELMPMPPQERTEDCPWPYWPMKLRTSSSHEEGGERCWNIMTKCFEGENGQVKSLKTVLVEWQKSDVPGERPKLVEKPETEKVWDADLVFLALGFLGPRSDDVISRLNLDIDDRTNIVTGSDYQSSTSGVFAAGDCHRGQSLIVWAIKEGRDCAAEVDRFLSGESYLPKVKGVDITATSRMR